MEIPANVPRPTPNCTREEQLAEINVLLQKLDVLIVSKTSASLPSQPLPAPQPELWRIKCFKPATECPRPGEPLQFSYRKLKNLQAELLYRKKQLS
jgi:hypothetical protein